MLSFLPGELPGGPGGYRRQPAITPFPGVYLYLILIIPPGSAGGIVEVL
jgi:hypothetical protein